MKNVSRRALCACLALPAAARAQGSPGPDEAVARMVEGNRQFRIDDPTQPGLNQSRRSALATGQAPFAAILGCSDSRTAPESVFHSALGEIFTIRVAGNSALQGAVGSLEYAVAELHVPLIVVLGHERCGAVTAAHHVLESGEPLPFALEELVAPILPALIQTRRADKAEWIDAAVRLHARRTAQRLREEDGIIAGAIRAGRLRVEAAYYNLEDGAVSMLPA